MNTPDYYRLALQQHLLYSHQLEAILEAEADV